LTVLLIAAIPGLLGLVLWAVVDLENFVLFAVLGAIVFPASLAKPFGTNVDAADILLVIALIGWVVSNSVGGAPNPWTRGNSMFVPAVLYLAVNVASIVWSINTHSTLVFAVQLIELIILYPVVFATLPQSIRKIRVALIVLVVLTTGEGIATLIQYAVSPTAHIQGTYLPGLNKNALGSFLGAGLVVATALWLGGRGHSRHWLIPPMGILAVGAIASESRGAVLGAGTAVILMAFLLGRKRVPALLLAVFLVALYVTVIAPNEARKASLAGGYSSGTVRSISWSYALHEIEHQPWIGTGARTYEEVLPPPITGTIPDPNNLFLLTWAELGIPGMLALGFLLFRFAQLMVRSRRLPGDAGVVSVAAGGVALSLIVHFQVDISWVRGETTMEFAMIGLMLAASRLSSPLPSPSEGDVEVLAPDWMDDLAPGPQVAAGVE